MENEPNPHETALGEAIALFLVAILVTMADAEMKRAPVPPPPPSLPQRLKRWLARKPTALPVHPA